ncbi:acetate--CoA ligase family protein [Gemmobacter sp. 24YEA27]|uniref:acetate--CoA ligase family protein n=1 Tax=Gemmobacter sp. 24YEA27 TaxID=3040672 RepID=UPI0024B3834A|nr:acetate--CoA ligase family protein [Gemmobacter sp. 24YEA27]
MAADLAAPFGLSFPPVPEASRKRLSETLGPIVTIANPLDYNTFIWGDLEKTTEVFSAMLEPYDAGLYVIDMPRDDRCDPSSYFPALDSIVAAQKATGKPAFPVVSISENFGEARVQGLMDQGVCTLLGFETALAAIRAAQTPKGAPGWEPVKALAPRETRLLTEAEGKALLAAAGIPVPRAVTGATLAEVQAQATGLTAPIALKGLGFAHKTEAGAVRLGLASLEGEAEMPGATGYLAEEMVTGIIAEMLLGIGRDPVYGLTLTIGMGGVTAEVLADTVTLVWPADEAQILTAMRRLRLWPLLDGYRGRPKADVAAFATIAVRLGHLMAGDDSLEEIEINPVLLRETGAVAVDALIRRE